MHNPCSSIRWLTALVTFVSVPLDAPSEPVAESPLRWQRATAGIDSDGATAVAWSESGDRLAIGDARGVLVGPVGQPAGAAGQFDGGVGQPGFRRLLPRGPVRDLAFAEDGMLLVATDEGLYRLERDGRYTRLALGAGAAARAVTRVATRGGVSVAATGDGVFIAHDTQEWHRLAGAIPGGAARTVALQVNGVDFVCWSIVAGELWRTELQPSGDVWDTAGSQRITLPAGVRDGSALDIAVDLGGVALAVVFPTALAVMEWPVPGDGAASGSQPIDSGPLDARRSGPSLTDALLDWKVVRPQLPPGARMHRLVRGAGRFWLATDRGLLESLAVAGPWRRSGPPVGSAAIAAVVADADEVVAAAREGVWSGRTVPPFADPTLQFADPALWRPSSQSAGTALSGAPSQLAEGSLAVPEDPPIAQVHRAAIHYLGLERSRLEALRRGVRRRGWWPIVTVRGGGGWDHGRSIDRDEAFLSGETRYLTDRDSDRGDDFDVSLTLSWDLREVAYEPESIDVSHEAREVIELRDDVLDEITQLYFERNALLASLRAAGGSGTPEAQRLLLRADELAAGIDAWTGGWFSSRVATLAP